MPVTTETVAAAVKADPHMCLPSTADTVSTILRWAVHHIKRHVSACVFILGFSANFIHICHHTDWPPVDILTGLEGTAGCGKHNAVWVARHEEMCMHYTVAQAGL